MKYAVVNNADKFAHVGVIPVSEDDIVSVQQSMLDWGDTDLLFDSVNDVGEPVVEIMLNTRVFDDFKSACEYARDMLGQHLDSLSSILEHKQDEIDDLQADITQAKKQLHLMENYVVEEDAKED